MNSFRSFGLSCFVFLLTFNILAQSSIEDFVKEGIKYHDSGDYDKAIDTYEKALKLDSKSTLANYEISLSYFTKGDYKKAIKYSDKVIKQDKEYMVESYLTKGSSLDLLGKTKKSIKLFEKAIKETKGHYLLHYNLALNHFKLDNLKLAEQSVLQAIGMNSSHSSSHLMLANIHSSQKHTVQASLAAHYFLFLEPNTSRSLDALTLLKANFEGNVSTDKDDPNTTLINLSDDDGSEFRMAELMMSMIVATNNSEEHEGKSEDELFVVNTESFFSFIGESNSDGNKGVWWDLYVHFFYDLSKSDHLETYCKYITQSKLTSDSWLNDNEDKLASFDNWLKGN